MFIGVCISFLSLIGVGFLLSPNYYQKPRKLRSYTASKFHHGHNWIHSHDRSWAGKARINHLKNRKNWEEVKERLHRLKNNLHQSISRRHLVNEILLEDQLDAYIAEALEPSQKGENYIRTPIEEEIHVAANHLLELLEEIMAEAYFRSAMAQWDFEVNLTHSKKQDTVDKSSHLGNVQKFVWALLQDVHPSDFHDPGLRRQVKLLQIQGLAALPEVKYKHLEQLVEEMSSIYSTAKVQKYNSSEANQMILDPDLVTAMEQSRDPAELKYLYLSWRNATGDRMIENYIKYVQLMNEAAILDKFPSAAEMWLSPYEQSKPLDILVDELWREMRPLYLELHAYVRRKLRETYGPSLIPQRGLIPAHLVGDLWGQSFQGIYNISLPYPDYKDDDFDTKMIELGVTQLDMVHEAEKFFLSLGFEALPAEFWNNSIFVKPPDVDMVCHASSWDFYDRYDFRIKMCASVSFEDLITIHHEMGHIEYFIQYRDQPLVFRDGANPGFHEAIGDVITLSVTSRIHLRRMHLLPNISTSVCVKDKKKNKFLAPLDFESKLAASQESSPSLEDIETKLEMNSLYMTALRKVAFLPFSLSVDIWRWGVFRKEIVPEDYNIRWWQTVETFQGLSPPEPPNPRGFDPGAKYHVAAGVPYIRYFVAALIQFQFHEALCKDAMPNVPLHQCDVFGSEKAGQRLRSMLSLGASMPWPEAMKVMTGEESMDTRPFLRYFHPLYEWLSKDNKDHGEVPGWD